MAQLKMMLPGIACLLVLLTTANADVTIGTDFVLAFPCSGFNYWPSLIVVNSNSNQARVTVDSAIPGFTTMNLTVARNSGQQVTPKYPELPSVTLNKDSFQINFTDPHTVIDLQVCDTNIVSPLGFRVQSTVPIALYVNQRVTSDFGSSYVQYLVLPTNMLASQYVGGYNNRYYGIIVAIQDGTRITMGSTQVTLNRFQVYYSYASAPISANVAFAYILTYSSFPGNYPYQSVMALPKSYTSTQWTAVADNSNSGVNLYIWAFESNTQVSINGGTNVTVPLDQPYAASTFNGGASVIASKPVQVLQYNTMIYPYTQQMYLSSSVQFYTFDSTGNSNSQPQLMIIAPLLSTGNILLDGIAISALQYRRIPYTQDFYYTQSISSPAMLHTISTTTSNDRFLAYLSSNGKYPIALNLPTAN